MDALISEVLCHRELQCYIQMLAIFLHNVPFSKCKCKKRSSLLPDLSEFCVLLHLYILLEQPTRGKTSWSVYFWLIQKNAFAMKTKMQGEEKCNEFNFRKENQIMCLPWWSIDISLMMFSGSTVHWKFTKQVILELTDTELFNQRKHSMQCQKTYPSRGLTTPGNSSPKDNLFILWLIWFYEIGISKWTKGNRRSYKMPTTLEENKHEDWKRKKEKKQVTCCSRYNFLEGCPTNSK